MSTRVLAVVVGLSFAGQVWLHERSEHEHAAQLAKVQAAIADLADRAPTVVAGPAYAVSRSVDCQHDRAAAPTAPTSSNPPSGATAKAEPAARTYEQQRSLDTATQMIDAASARGQLTQVDADALQSELQNASSPDEARQLMLRLAVLVNTNKIALEPGTRLF